MSTTLGKNIKTYRKNMFQNAVFVEHHGVAGNFLAVNHQVVASGKLRRYAQRLQRIHNGLQILQEVNLLAARFDVLDEREVEVPDGQVRPPTE